MKSLARLTVAALALMLAITSTGSTSAAVFNTYTDETAWRNNGGDVLDTFGSDDYSDLTQGFPLGTQARSSADDPNLGSYSYTLSSPGGLFTGGPTSPRDVYVFTQTNNVLDFSVMAGPTNPHGNTNVLAFGGYFLVVDTSFGSNATTGTITATINGGQFQIQQVVTPADVTAGNNFFGWVVADAAAVSTGITSVQISITSAAAQPQAGVSSVAFAVPEPSTYALLAMAATTGGLCQLRRRRKAAA